MPLGELILGFYVLLLPMEVLMAVAVFHEMSQVT